MARLEKHTAAEPRLLAALLDTYSVRIMLGLVASLAVVALCFHLPLDRPLNAIGWQLSPLDRQPMLDVMDVKTRQPQQAPSGVPITQIGAQEEAVEEGEEDQSEETERLPEPVQPPPLEKLKGREAVLDFAENPPDIVGGLGAYYIHIDYPEKAIEQDIQGRLVLTFVVETDGRPSDIHVLKSLHPLCDSAAVHALRRTRFVPGRQNGETVRVRMRLPVQFKLIDPNQPDSSRTETAESF